MNPFPDPNIQAKPQPQKRMPQRHVSMMPSSMTLIVSLLRANPPSSIMNPACMKNTRQAVTSTHMVLIGLTYAGVGGVAGVAAAGVAGAVTAGAAGVAAGAVTAGDSSAHTVWPPSPAFTP